MKIKLTTILTTSILIGGLVTWSFVQAADPKPKATPPSKTVPVTLPDSYAIELTFDEVQLVVKGLAELPLKESINLFSKIQSQVNEQQKTTK